MLLLRKSRVHTTFLQMLSIWASQLQMDMLLSPIKYSNFVVKSFSSFLWVQDVSPPLYKATPFIDKRCWNHVCKNFHLTNSIAAVDLYLRPVSPFCILHAKNWKLKISFFIQSCWKRHTVGSKCPKKLANHLIKHVFS